MKDALAQSRSVKLSTSISFFLKLVETSSSGSSGQVRGARNMMRPPLAAIFFMTNFYRAGGAGPLAPPDPLLPSICNIKGIPTQSVSGSG